MPLFLRTTDCAGRSYGGFQWPLEIGAEVVAPDWKPTAKCGNGLHGLLDGLGNSIHLCYSADALWWIVEADNTVDLDGKHKFERCRVIAFGPRDKITSALHAMRPGPIHGLCLTGGDRSTLTGGYGSTLTGGYGSTLTGGDYSTLTGGNGSTLTGGDHSTLTGSNGSTLISGYGSTLTGGYGSALMGDSNSMLTGGNYSTLIFLKWVNGRRRVLTAYVGEDGIQPGIAYRANDDHTAVIPYCI